MPSHFICGMLTSWFKDTAQNSVIGKTSRRFEELGPEILHRCSMGHYAKSYGGGFLTLFFIFDLGGSEWRAFPPKSLGPPKNGEKSQKIKKTLRQKLRNGPWNICAKFQDLTP